MNLMKSASRFLKKNGGTILAIGASVGVVLTAIETGKASIKAEKLIEMNSAEPAYTMKEKIQDCWIGQVKKAQNYSQKFQKK